MFGADWCDVNSDDDLEGIPELPPLPLIEIQSCPTTPEKESGTHDEHSTSAGGSCPENDGSPEGERLPAVPVKNRFEDLARFRSNSPRMQASKDEPRVCFIGNFPPTATLEDFRDFLNSKRISFTEIRMGPRKKQNSNGFGYVDLSSQEDFENLLRDDGCTYMGRKIRIDTATPHKKTNRLQDARMKRHAMNHRKSNKGVPRHGRQDLRLQQRHSAPSRSQLRAHGGRASRFFLARKTGTRNFQKRSPKNRSRKSARDPFGGARLRAFGERTGNLHRLE